MYVEKYRLEKTRQLWFWGWKQDFHFPCSIFCDVSIFTMSTHCFLSVEDAFKVRQTVSVMIGQFWIKVKVKVTQFCPTLCNPMYCSLPGSSVCGILQASILEWVVIPFSRASSQPRDQMGVSCIAGGFFTI